MFFEKLVCVNPGQITNTSMSSLASSAQGLAEALHGKLARGVFAAGRDAAFPCNRGDIDDGRPMARTQQRKKDACRLRKAEEVDLHDPTQPIRSGLGEMTGGTDAGIVDQHVCAAEDLLRRLHHAPAIFGAGHVGPNRRQGPAGRLHCRGQFPQQVLRTSGGQHLGPALNSRFRQGAPNALRCSSDDHPRSGDATTLSHDWPLFT